MYFVGNGRLKFSSIFSFESCVLNDSPAEGFRLQHVTRLGSAGKESFDAKLAWTFNLTFLLASLEVETRALEAGY